MAHRRIIIAGNWKMNNDIPESIALARELRGRIPELDDKHEVVLCPPFTSLAAVFNEIRDTAMKLGAQNLYPEHHGAYTGEISPSMLKSAGCAYVILGHSERRRYFNETGEFINRKVHAALREDLQPIICVGETLQERERGVTADVVTQQVLEVLAGINEAQIQRAIIAYEPVWAIGTGRNATPDQAEEVHLMIRSLLAERYGSAVAESVTIQYGGSVNADNAAALLAQPDIDGALVGGACLRADSFTQIIEASLAEKP